MSRRKCPGMDPANFRPEDIKLQKCCNCGHEIEFWKDDVYLKCDSCGQENVNPALGNTCLTWCKSAAQCIGDSGIERWLKEKEQQCKKADD
jgi:hypothetical protein